MHYLSQAARLRESLIADRRYLHQNPECGFDLPLTTRYVWDRLTDIGYRPQTCGPSGITATVGGPGPVFLLRADMDALPMAEESGLPFASRVDRAHLCGHDMHTAMLLGAARLLKENERALPGTVKLMFQPAEEILEGAKSMIRSGVLRNPQVGGAMGIHMLPQTPTGVLLYNTGAVSASSDTVHIKITGKGGHGAQPDKAIDPINVAAHLHLALQELVSREVDPAESVVLTFGMIQAGEAHNVIPETAVMRGTLRAFNREVREFMLRRITEIAAYTALSFRAAAEVTFPASTGSVLVDPQVADTVSTALRAMLGDAACQKVDQRAGESEDFSAVSEQVPSVFFFLGAGTAQEGYPYPLHNPRVIFNEESLPVGAAAYAQGATAWLAAMNRPLQR